MWREKSGAAGSKEQMVSICRRALLKRAIARHSERSEESRTNPHSLTISFHSGFIVLINNSFLFLFHYFLFTTTSFLDENLPVGEYEYYVVAHYEMGCVADSSNHVKVEIEVGIKEKGEGRREKAERGGLPESCFYNHNY